VTYNTKHGDAVLAYLLARKDSFVTVAQITGHLQKEQVHISRPTVYRQLEKLVGEGKVRKYVFGGASVSSFRYIGSGEHERECYHLKCEICDGIFDIHCGEVSQVTRHISEFHEFQVEGMVFYGKCKTCLKK
jgi:Fur family ferric uptake transcriptional regulator